MRALLIFFTILLIITLATPLRSDDQEKQTETLPAGITETAPVYPIAPGVWYPGQPLPENPVRYYRVRCWPGCHRGSSHGAYPREPLDMTPIFHTSTIDLWPPATKTK